MKIEFIDILNLSVCERLCKKEQNHVHEEMLTSLHSSSQDGIMLAKPSSSSSSSIHLYSMRGRIHLFKQRAHEFHTALRTNVLRVLPRRQFSYQHMHRESDVRLPLFSQ